MAMSMRKQRKSYKNRHNKILKQMQKHKCATSAGGKKKVCRKLERKLDKLAATSGARLGMEY